MLTISLKDFRNHPAPGMIPLASLHLIQVDTRGRTSGFISSPASWYKANVSLRNLAIAWDELLAGTSCAWDELLVIQLELLAPAGSVCHCLPTWQAWGGHLWQRIYFRLVLTLQGAKTTEEQVVSCWVPFVSPGSYFTFLEIHREIWFGIRTTCSKTASLISTF